MLIPLSEQVYFDAVTHDPDTGSIVDADSVPTFDVFEESTDAPILSAQVMTKRTSKTGDYRGTFTASTGNGFEAGKWYSVVVSGTVTGSVSSVAITAKKVALHFRCALAEVTAGVPQADVAALTAPMADSVPADGVIPSLTQAIYMLNQYTFERVVSGLTVHVKKVDGSTELITLTLNSAGTPTTVTRSA